MTGEPRVRQIATDLLDAVRAATPGMHCLRVVDAGEFRHLDLDYYEATATALVNCGFSVLTDIQDMSICEGTGIATFARVLVGAGGSVVATVSHAQPQLGMAGRLKAALSGIEYAKAAELRTDFTDDTTLTTTTAPATMALPSPPTDGCVRLEPGTLARTLVARHVVAVKQHLAGHPGVRIRPIRNLVDFLQLVNALGARRRRLLEQEGWVTPEYVEARLGQSEHERVAAVHALIVKMLRDERTTMG